MQKYILDEMETDVFISKELCDEMTEGRLETPSASLAHAVERFLGQLDALEHEYATLYRKHVGKPRIGCLMAHGGGGTGRGWTYYDDEKERLVQQWIYRNQKQYGLLILYSCNPIGYTPKAKETLLLLPDQAFSELEISRGSAHLSLVHPDLGELDPVIDYELTELRKKTESAAA